MFYHKCHIYKTTAIVNIYTFYLNYNDNNSNNNVDNNNINNNNSNNKEHSAVMQKTNYVYKLYPDC